MNVVRPIRFREWGALSAGEGRGLEATISLLPPGAVFLRDGDDGVAYGAACPCDSLWAISFHELPWRCHTDSA
jgi:hypothetical protein